MKILIASLLVVGACSSRKAPSVTQNDTNAPAPDTEETDVATAELNGTRPASPLPAPEFEVLAHDGTPRTREALIGHPTVMWFYPRAATSG